LISSSKLILKRQPVNVSCHRLAVSIQVLAGIDPLSIIFTLLLDSQLTFTWRWWLSAEMTKMRVNLNASSSAG